VTNSAPATTSDAEKPRLADLAPGLIAVAVMLALMWGEEIVDLLPGTRFDRWGVRPRSVRGLFGIVFSPFLHTGFPHLIANTIPFAILGGAIALGGTKQYVEVSGLVALSSGAGIWIFGGGNSVHIGASGLVFGYLTYLVSRGIIAKNVWWILGGLVTLAFYGGLFWGLLPSPRVSWLGHVFGAVGGVLAAWMIHGDHDLDDDPATSKSI
jgi:membrane associated rhomboid family serine protease